MTNNQRGGALLVTMLTGALVSGLAGMLVSIVTTEEAVEANHRRGVEALYAADGLLTTVIAELTQAPDWHSVLDGSRRSSLRDGPSRVSLADGSAIDAEEETHRLQRQIARSSGTAVLPLWRLFAWGWFADLVGEPDQPRLLYVAAWVRDDWADPDADRRRYGRQATTPDWPPTRYRSAVAH